MPEGMHRDRWNLKINVVNSWFFDISSLGKFVFSCFQERKNKARIICVLFCSIKTSLIC